MSRRSLPKFLRRGSKTRRSIPSEHALFDRYDRSHSLFCRRSARDLIKNLLPDGIAVSILAYLEAYQGVIESPDPIEARRKFDAFFAGVPIVAISPAVARRCAELRSLLRRQGKNPRRRAFDLVIAAAALEHGLALLTHNAQDYHDIPDLVRHDPLAER